MMIVDLGIEWPSGACIYVAPLKQPVQALFHFSALLICMQSASRAAVCDYLVLIYIWALRPSNSILGTPAFWQLHESCFPGALFSGILMYVAEFDILTSNTTCVCLLTMQRARSPFCSVLVVVMAVISDTIFFGSGLDLPSIGVSVSIDQSRVVRYRPQTFRGCRMKEWCSPCMSCCPWSAGGLCVR